MAPNAQNMMLAIHGKKTEAVDLKTPLISYVRNTYSDREADDAADDLNMVQQLRAEMANMVAHPTSREIFCRQVYCTLDLKIRVQGSETLRAQLLLMMPVNSYSP